MPDIGKAYKSAETLFNIIEAEDEFNYVHKIDESRGHKI